MNNLGNVNIDKINSEYLIQKKEIYNEIKTKNFIL